MIPQYRTPLPKGASKEAVELSQEVNKWANVEHQLLFQVDDLEMLISELGDNHKRIATLKTILEEKESDLRVAEKLYKIALHRMCEAL